MFSTCIATITIFNHSSVYTTLVFTVLQHAWPATFLVISVIYLL